ncbi:MAG: hypothetical protein HC855_15655 [Rhizobiales bacterium]|nr:hypothetical protein [Hyphomicrobiales bacterium]
MKPEIDPSALTARQKDEFLVHLDEVKSAVASSNRRLFDALKDHPQMTDDLRAILNQWAIELCHITESSSAHVLERFVSNPHLMN